MPIISTDIMKIIDGRETEKSKKNKTNKDIKEATVKGWELNDFVVHLS